MAAGDAKPAKAPAVILKAAKGTRDHFGSDLLLRDYVL